MTATERKVALFIVGAFVVGLGIRLYQQTFPGEQTFDYRDSDSTFAALSRDIAEETAERRPSGEEGLININTAPKSELVRLPGIGEVTAERIILYREDQGPFSRVEDLQKVKGISKLKLEKIRALITVQ